VHETAIAYRREQERKSEIVTENPGAEVAFGKCDRVAWAESYVLIDAAILAESHLAFGAAIKVIEDGPGYAALGNGPEICDAHYAWRGDGTGSSSHLRYTWAESS
jgi:hypothetical protein